MRRSCLVLLLPALAALLCLNVSAQTFTVVHAFTGSTDGAYPAATLTMDRAGNLYGTTFYGGAQNVGTVFKLTHKPSGWLLTPLYSFSGSDGAQPRSSVIFGPDGSLYGNTEAGGNLTYGTVYNLKPQPQACASVYCQWRETTLYQFTDDLDGEATPWGDLHFDARGNIFGTTIAYGGIVYELTPAAHGWTYQIVYSFPLFGDGPSQPYAGVISDAAGNLFGTTYSGGQPICGRMQSCGTVFELSPSGSSWTMTVLHDFDGTDGGVPIGGLIADRFGNLYGANSIGFIYMLTPTNGGWSFNSLARVQGTCPIYLGASCGPWDTLAMGPDGSLYGSAYALGAYGYGSIFRLTPTAGGWVYTVLHDFTNGSDGAYPVGGVTLDSDGNLYGTDTVGGSGGVGIAFEITP